MLTGAMDIDEWTVDRGHDRGSRDGTLARHQRTHRVNKACKGRADVKGGGLAGYVLVVRDGPAAQE